MHKIRAGRWGHNQWAKRIFQEDADLCILVSWPMEVADESEGKEKSELYGNFDDSVVDF